MDTKVMYDEPVCGLAQLRPEGSILGGSTNTNITVSDPWPGITVEEEW